MYKNIENTDRLAEARRILSEASRQGYQDIFLLSNRVLSKNPFTNNFLNRFMNNLPAKRLSGAEIFAKLLRYYFSSAKKFCGYLLEFMVYRLNPVNFRPAADAHPQLILIDTYFILNKIEETGAFRDQYFSGLQDLLDKQKKHYAYLPVFVGPKKYLHLRRVLNILKRQKVPVLCEYGLLSFLDLARVIFFIGAYPFRVFGFLKKIPGADEYGAGLLRSELMDTIDTVTFDSFIRYLAGRKTAQLPYRNIEVISWCENQVISKNLYKGLRQAGRKVKIYGAQLFLYSRAHLNIPIDEDEESLGVTPDRVIVNGEFFIPGKTRLDYRVGPSLRYSRLFTYTVTPGPKNDILALLPYSKEDTENILAILRPLAGLPGRLLIKSHPAVPVSGLQNLLPQGAAIVEGDIYKLFETAGIIISSASGTLVEAASLGIPAIVVKNTNGINYNPLPEYGRQVIWHEASSAAEVQQLIAGLREELQRNPEKIQNIAREYKRMFFVAPSEEMIAAAFDL